MQKRGHEAMDLNYKQIDFGYLSGGGGLNNNIFSRWTALGASEPDMFKQKLYW